MAHITGHIRIAAPAGRVFDTVADLRNEPSVNPAMTGVELESSWCKPLRQASLHLPPALDQRGASAQQRVGPAQTHLTG
jgi:hypothetical protein